MNADEYPEVFSDAQRQAEAALYNEWGTCAFPLCRVTEEERKKCWDYAEARRPQAGHYGNRGQENADRIVEQIAIGKMGEIVAYRTLSCVLDVGEPDFNVYSGDDKNWDSDLRSDQGGYRFAVKTCEFERKSRIPPSWTFQESDKSGRSGHDVILDSEDEKEFVCLVILDGARRIGRITFLLPAPHLRSRSLLMPPLSRRLRDAKKVAYWYTLVTGSYDSCVGELSGLGWSGLSGVLNFGNNGKRKVIKDKLQSPFRYPGAKTRLLVEIMSRMRPYLRGCHTYVEPFVGGGSVVLCVASEFRSLGRVVVNDVDPAIGAFWECMLNADDTEWLAAKVRSTAATVKEHGNQRVKLESESARERAFAGLFLNRTSFSGILTSGPVGGYDQGSKWTVDCRYPQDVLPDRISAIGDQLGSKLEAWSSDFADVIASYDRMGVVIYCDAPYFVKGDMLYRCKMGDADHMRLAEQLRGLKDAKFVVSYDNAPEIARMYRGWARVEEIVVRYSIKGQGRKSWGAKKELLISSWDGIERVPFTGRVPVSRRPVRRRIGKR